ncbi:MAG TPA: NAD(P)H-hydrate dehydratase [Gammaproteobacteria bacterium]|nr:NAD(P)H-hydrate dehydratase [Gammaproteobacteria bacterium]
MPEPDYIPLYTAAQVRELDRLAIETHGIPGYQLMCRAGQALADGIARHWPAARRINVWCGPGNNGGDGYVVARLLQAAGSEVRVLSLSDPDRLRGDAAQAVQDFRAQGGQCTSFTSGLDAGAVDLHVDALLGTGLDRPVEGAIRSAIEALNAQSAPVLTVDIPSGLHADSGRVLGEAVQAQHTLTFIGRKRGLYTGAGVRCAGQVGFDDLGVPADICQELVADTLLVEQPAMGPLAVARAIDAHKGDFGHVLVVGGERGMSGAARLAAEAAARCGAGLVSVATRAEHAAGLNAGCPELMVHAVTGVADLQPLLARASVVVVGPGLGQGDWSRHLFESVLDSGLPLVVDADALNLLARDPCQRDNWILTPHPGEAGRLLGRTAREVGEDRFAALRQLVERYRGVAVLKGAGTLTMTGGEPVHLCARGNPGMASGGMGDVLSGVLAALLAQGLDGFEAASAGVFLHASAADLAARQQGERGLLASDLLPWLRGLLNERV